MAFNGSGTFVRIYNWQTDKINGIKVRADRMDGDSDGFATGLSTCITKDGQQTVTANIPFAGFKLTGLGSATARTDAMSAGQYQDSALVSYTAAGTDTYTLTPAPAVTSYTTYQSWRVLFTNANLTITPTLNVSGLGAKSLKKNGSTALAIGDIAAGSIWWVTYDGTNFVLNGQIYVLAAQPTLQLTDGGRQSGTFNASANTKYRMDGTATQSLAVLPGSSGTCGDLILLSAYGASGGAMCGTINGSAQTLAFEQQTLMITYTTAGWV